jgi:hypothetical protein
MIAVADPDEMGCHDRANLSHSLDPQLLRFASRKYWNELSRDLKPVYTAVNSGTAAAALDDLQAKWGTRYRVLRT